MDEAKWFAHYVLHRFQQENAMQGTQSSSFVCSAICALRTSTTNKPHKQQGITLVETVIVISILSILASIAVTSYSGLQERLRLEGLAAELATDIHYVQSEAIARNHAIRISFGTDTGGTCYALHTGGAGDCSCSSDGASFCTGASDSVLKSVGLLTARGVRIQANVTSILFDPTRGTVSPAGSMNLIASDNKTIRHVVNIVGRTRTCSPNGSAVGYKVC